jgi:nucleoid-associated protein YgaU
MAFHICFSNKGQSVQDGKEEQMTQQGQIATNAYYTVGSSDSLSSIALQAYNNDSQPYLMAIYSLNQSEIGHDPNVINPGESLYIPPINIPPKRDSFYIVQTTDDTLPSIAQQAYGDPNLWPLIFSDNREVFSGENPTTIFSVNPPQILLIKDWPKGGNIHAPTK